MRPSVSPRATSVGVRSRTFGLSGLFILLFLVAVLGALHKRALEKTLEQRLIVDLLAVNQKPLDRGPAAWRHRGHDRKLAVVARLFDFAPLALRNEKAFQAVIETDGRAENAAVVAAKTAIGDAAADQRLAETERDRFKMDGHGLMEAVGSA